MPLWRIYSHSDTFTDEQKAGLSQAITKLYTDGAGLPAFYVVVAFVPVINNTFFIGGQAKQNFVRITIEHIARTLPDPDTEEGAKVRRRVMDRWHAVSSTLSHLQLASLAQ
jgi:phenylpyruvate tautomerase PptA (4-oxalocrotonate tautomerase family)